MARLFWLALIEQNPAADRLFEIRIDGQPTDHKALEVRKGYAKS
jgi:hypothetical protein